MQADGNLMFLTFHSRLEYGFFSRSGAFGGNDEIPFQDVQLWFAGIDLRALGLRRMGRLSARRGRLSFALALEPLDACNHVPDRMSRLQRCMGGVSVG